MNILRLKYVEDGGGRWRTRPAPIRGCLTSIPTFTAFMTTSGCCGLLGAAPGLIIVTLPSILACGLVAKKVSSQTGNLCFRLALIVPVEYFSKRVCRAMFYFLLFGFIIVRFDVAEFDLIMHTGERSKGFYAKGSSAKTSFLFPGFSIFCLSPKNKKAAEQGQNFHNRNPSFSLPNGNNALGVLIFGSSLCTELPCSGIRTFTCVSISRLEHIFCMLTSKYERRFTSRYYRWVV